MPFVPIIAFCASIAGEPDMSMCSWVSDELIHPRTETACVLRAQELKDNQNIIVAALGNLYEGYDWTGPVGYQLYCIPENEEDDFWKSKGLS